MDAWDPTGEKARYVGVCRGCGAYTQPRNGKGDGYRYCKRCHPGVIERKWTRELLLAAMVERLRHYRRSLALLDERLPQSPLLEALRDELAGLLRDRALLAGAV